MDFSLAKYKKVIPARTVFIFVVYVFICANVRVVKNARIVVSELS